MGQQTGSKLGKVYVKAVYCHPAYLTSMQSTSWEMLGWMKHKLESRFPGEISITSYMQVTPPLMAESEELKILLMKVKEESEKVCLKFSIQKTKIMASSPISLWQINGEAMKTVRDFIFWGVRGAPKSLQMVTTAMKLNDACFLEEKLWPTQTALLFETFTNKGPSGQSYGFASSQVWTWEWTLKKAEHQRIDAFELWCWRRLLRVPCTAERSNQSILKGISPEYSLEGLLLKLKL